MKPNFYEAYYHELQTAFDSGTPSVRYNSDRAHNAVIMCFMFDHSHEVNMFCGQMSVLRDGFFERINQHNLQNNPYLGDELRVHLKESLDRFLAKSGSQFHILFESYSSTYGKDLISRERMVDAITEEKISMKSLSADLKIRKHLDHFTVSDAGMYRFEDDKEQHSAICSFNDKDSTDQLQRNFQKLYNLENNLVVNF